MTRPADDQPDVRLTPQRRAVLDALGDSAEGRTAAELFRRLHELGSPVGLSTVYRALATLVDAGVVDAVRDDEGRQLFHAGPVDRPGHYLVCRQCGRHLPIDARPVLRWAADKAAEHDFAVGEPLVRLTGRCPRCAARDLPATSRT
ncbi:Fur family transcriptional regulator [Actinosynnema sp. NPDC059797]